EHRENRAFGTAPDLQPDETRDREQQEYGQRDQERRVHREDGRRQHRGEGQQREKNIITDGARGIKTNDRSENQQVNRGEQRGVEQRIRRAGRQFARENPKVDRKENEIAKDECSRIAMRQFRFATARDAPAFVSERDQRRSGRHHIEFARGDQRQNARRDQQEK